MPTDVGRCWPLHPLCMWGRTYHCGFWSVHVLGWLVVQPALAGKLRAGLDYVCDEVRVGDDRQGTPPFLYFYIIFTLSSFFIFIFTPCLFILYFLCGLCRYMYVCCVCTCTCTVIVVMSSPLMEL